MHVCVASASRAIALRAPPSRAADARRFRGPSGLACAVVTAGEAVARVELRAAPAEGCRRHAELAAQEHKPRMRLPDGRRGSMPADSPGAWQGIAIESGRRPPRQCAAVVHSRFCLSPSCR